MHSICLCMSIAGITDHAPDCPYPAYDCQDIEGFLTKAANWKKAREEKRIAMAQSKTISFDIRTAYLEAQKTIAALNAENERLRAIITDCMQVLNRG